MAGPNVGEVSVRVMPDTKGFAAALRAELGKIKDLTVTVNVELNDAVVKAELAKLSTEKIDIPADVKLDDDQLGKALAGLKKIEIPAKINVDTSGVAKAKAEIDAAIPNTKTVKVRIDNPQLGAFTHAFSSAFSGATTLVKRDFDNLQSTVSAFGSAGVEAASNVGEAFSQIGAVFSKLGSIASVATTLASIPAIAAAVAAGGAAITVAYGAASTAVAAVPAAIGLIGAPIAAVTLGMKGIEAAAKSIKPQFDALQKSVSNAFQAGLTPVLQNLANNLFPKLQVGLAATATALSSVAAQTANWLTSSAGISALSTTIGNINAAIGQINLVPLVDGFVRLAGNQAALKALTDTVNELGVQIQKIADNPALDQAFSGLGGVLKSVTTAFGDLVNNGIKLFAAAAPGAQAAIDGIGAFLNKFDWTALGAAAGGALRGIGDAIGGIPQGTVDAITSSFTRLSAVFQDPAFAKGLQDWAALIPGVVDAIGELSAKGAELGTFLNDVRVAFAEADIAVKKFSDSIGTTSGAADKAQRELDISLGKIRPSIDTNLGGAAAAAAVQSARIKSGFIGPISPMPVEAGQIAQDTASALQVPLGTAPATVGSTAADIVAAFGGGLGGLLIGAQQATAPVPGVFANMADILQSKVPVIGQRVGSDFGTNLNSSLSLGLATVGDTTTQGFVPVAGAATAGTQAAVDAVNSVLPGVGTAFQTAFAGIQAIATAAFTALNAQFTQFGTTLTGITPLIAAFGNTFTTLNPQLLAFGTTFTTLNPQILAFGTTLTTLNPQILAFGTTLTTLNPAILAFGTTLTTLNPQLLAFGTTLTTLNPQMLAFGTSLTALNPQILAFGTSLTTINPQLLAFGTSLTTLNPQMLAFGTSLTTLNPQLLALGTSLIALNPAILALGTNLTTANASLLAFGTALTTAGAAATAFGAAVQAAFTLAVASITTGMTQAVAAVTAGFAQINVAGNQGWTQFQTATLKAMTDFVTAITDGMAKANTAIKSGLDAAVSTINGYAGAFKAAGANLGQAFVDGILSKVAAAKAAGAKLGQAAADGVNSTKGISSASPSKKGIASGEFLGLGLIKGTENMHSDVTAAGATLGALAADATQAEFDRRFSALAAANFSDVVATQLSSAVHASVDNSSAGDVIIHNVVQIGSDTIKEIWQTLDRADKADLLLQLAANR